MSQMRKNESHNPLSNLGIILYEMPDVERDILRHFQRYFCLHTRKKKLSRERARSSA